MGTLRFFFAVTLIGILVSCSKSSPKDQNIDIIIQEYETYEYNLSGMTYTVYNDTKPNIVVNLKLTDGEKDKLVKSYYECGLNEMKGITLIEDECFIAPKFSTTILIKSKEGNQKIEIDSRCDNFFLYNFLKARKVKKFLNFVDLILKNKPEIKNTPRTDKIYE